jgi:hypothetical protein
MKSSSEASLIGNGGFYMSQKRNCKNLRGITIYAILLFLFCFFSVSAAQSEGDLDGKYLKAWIKGNGKQITDNNGKLKEAKLKKKDSEIYIKLEAFDCDGVDGEDFPQNDCDGYCYYIINLESDSGACEEKNIGELYTCGINEKTGSAWIEKYDDSEESEDSHGFLAAFITRQLFKKDGTLKKFESKAGSGFGYTDVDDLGDTFRPVFVFKNVLLKATEIKESDLNCTP